MMGVVSDSSDGKLVVSNALPSRQSSLRRLNASERLRDKPLKQKSPVAKISADRGNEDRA